MNLTATLRHLAGVYNLDAEELIFYAEEDDIGGYHSSAAKAKWSIGSIWEVEGQVLYALCRALRPHHVVEVGTFIGCSTMHLATALQRNGSGSLTTIDDGSHGGSYNVPDEFKDIIYVIRGNAVEELETTENYDFLFQDSGHGIEHVTQVFEAALPKANPGALLVAHDAAHFLVGSDVVGGMRAVGLSPEVVSIEPSDCGLAFYRMEGEAVMPVPSDAIHSDTLKAVTNFYPTNWEGDEQPDQVTADYSDLTKVELEEALLDRGVDLDSIEGTGARGNVLKEDLIKALEKNDK